MTKQRIRQRKGQNMETPLTTSHNATQRITQREKTLSLTCASNEDSDQPACPRSLISLRCLHKETLHPWKSNAQADLNLRWAHMSEGMFSEVVAKISYPHSTPHRTFTIIDENIV